ncbi:ergothioneine biosynthesis glutamate--cysteine ligase EgtA [Kitasatospora sp. NBC_01287]|uniref:ergothioneine biosynthesis glutamate--cysteine ligase EgtA n=1 Tax=Kitasatospora sp. NBC_01287 TaxID=2903573 RepID=UPI002255CA3E|nr:ergothioneine biosynthesis glutamate--cysteine ligase EgtA [Kitasatospora sp. NBC_01287]MCX4745475.1 ergothioneine biosynthesis glutamate--cysteine ligase EgtA [Kitasatospora sp. NBC_01287]
MNLARPSSPSLDSKPQAPPTVTPLTQSSAEAYVASTCFKIGPPGRVGVELEWLVHDSCRPHTAPDPTRVDAALDSLRLSPEDPLLPHGSRLTREPGGQVELSSPAADSLADCVELTRRDLATLRAAFAAQGLTLAGYGTEPHPREREVTLRQPRYLAMEEFFGRTGPWGKIMMCTTASTQVCLDAGTDDTSGPDGHQGFRARWELAHRLGPVLVAAFANSPLLDGRPTGYRSTRQAVWSRMDPSRTQAPTDADGDPRAAWARYVLDAAVLCVRRPEGHPWSAPVGLTFRDWLARPEAERPTLADLEYHITTLFPPVRPRGYLELRMIDAQPGDGWLVPAALAAALFGDPKAADAARAALEPLAAATAEPGPRGPAWTRAATRGMDDPVLRQAALGCFTAAESALADQPALSHLRTALVEFVERYPARGRCPADDLLDAPVAPRRPAPEEDAPC